MKRSSPVYRPRCKVSAPYLYCQNGHCHVSTFHYLGNHGTCLLTCPEYNDIQCDKRNSYRRKVKQDKAAVTSSNINSEGVDESIISNGSAEQPATSSRPRDDDIEPPSKKVRREPGEEDVDGEDEMNGEDEGEGEEEVEDEDGAEDGDEGEDGEEDEEGMEEVEDGAETSPGREESEEDAEGGLLTNGHMRDEALDELDSD